MMMNRLNNSIA